MAEDELGFSCDCGKVCGTVNLGQGRSIRLVCTCRDCQAYQHHLGRADVDLDANDGTDILQLAPSAVSLSQGEDDLKCLRMTRKGVLRWYANCCQSAIANTAPRHGAPIMGLLSNRIATQASRDVALGPARFNIFAKTAKGRLPRRRGMFSYAMTALPIFFAHKRLGLSDTFLFSDGVPLSPPQMISGKARVRAYSAIGKPRR